MSVMEAIRNYICTCPFLKDGKIGVDYLGDSPREYTIDSVPSSEIIKTYVDGGTLRQCLFIFASREAYGPTARKNLENIPIWGRTKSRSGFKRLRAAIYLTAAQKTHATKYSAG